MKLQNKEKTFLAISFLLVIGLIFAFMAPLKLKDVILDVIAFEGEGIEKLRAIRDSIEVHYDDFLDYSKNPIKNKNAYIELNGLMANLLGQKELNRTVKLRNGWLATPGELLDSEVLRREAAAFEMIYQTAVAKDITFLYVAAPHKISQYDPQLPIGVEDYQNDNIDALLSMLSSAEVPYMDLREEFKERGENQYDLYYRTDHHWTVECGQLVATILFDELGSVGTGKNKPQAYELENYVIEVYPKWHLGSNGQRTGRFYGGIDNFHLIYPNFATNYENLDTGKSGTFEDMFINMYPLEHKDIASRMTYDLVYGKSSSGHFVNHSLNVIDMTILVSTDSMGKVVVPFLTLFFSEVIVCSYDVDQVILALEQTSPDIVLMLNHPMSRLEGTN
ncbi:hypothetical protein LJC20_01085 [Eubacteriales bacterium OttesenSCG-928-M02]|nr:hypothetical protein [Eubacteriales bacterium OttesenSCG-928-M02]